MFHLPKSIENLISELSKLPGIGPKTAYRLAFYLLRSGEDLNESLGNALIGMKKGVNFCRECFGLTDNDTCPICSNVTRNKSIVCVVEEVLDVVALEETLSYKGLYHVLHGYLSPLDGIGPSQLKITELKQRIESKQNTSEEITEIILATNANVEGEATASYISQVIKSLNIKTTRLARGIPTGGNLEYIDSLTLQRAMEGRINF